MGDERKENRLHEDDNRSVVTILDWQLCCLLPLSLIAPSSSRYVDNLHNQNRCYSVRRSAIWPKNGYHIGKQTLTQRSRPCHFKVERQSLVHLLLDGFLLQNR